MNRRPKQLVFHILVILSITVLFFFPVNSAFAAPNQVVGPGSKIIVNSGSDTTLADNFITLREAILIANGGTGATGLNRGLTDNEMTFGTVNCTYNSSVANSNLIIGDCGEGLKDTIVFGAGGANVTLTANLPPVNDTDLTVINGVVGTTSFAKIDGSGLFHGLELKSNNSQVSNLLLTHMKDYAIQATSSNNLISGVQITNIAGNGIELKGGGSSSVYSAWVGATDTAACSAASINGSGLVLSGNTHGNTISFSMFRCAGQNGILLDGAGTTGNSISGGYVARIDGNKLDGINESNGAANNSWSGIPIYNNGGLGVNKSGLTPNAPFLYSKVINGAGFNVSGTGSPGSSVDVFLAAPDPSDAGEGGTLLVTVPVQSNGRWTAAVSGTNAACYTAIQTVTGLGSSVFSKNICQNGTLEIPGFRNYIPAIMN